MINREEFIELLQSIDWLYEYSDDPRIYRENAERHDAIQYALNERDRQGLEDFEELYKQYNPLI